jgi:two-component system, NtrC family, sensor histidine kinase HydH
VSPLVHAPRLGRWSRVAAIGAIPIMGVTLLAIVGWTVLGIRSASDTTTRGEADALHAALNAELFGPGDAPLADRLSVAFEALEPQGVRYIALVDAAGVVVGDAGRPPPDLDELGRWARSATPGQPERIGGRARVVYRRDREDRRRTADERRASRPPRPARVMEFDPRVANQLGTTARWLLAIGALAALTLTALAAVLVRWSLRRERAVREVEQARRLATLGQMSAVLAHEIRNPLASLKGNAQLLAMALPDGDKARAKADRVVAEATRLETLSNDLLEFAKDGELRIRDADPVALAREAADAVAPDRIDLEVGDAPRSWPLDADKVRRVLINLLDNAAEIDDGRVELRIDRDGRHLAIAVRDRGPGIGEADLPQIFEPFFTRRTNGTGLGLAVARRLVELHGGAIAARNATGGGAEIRITLPRSRRGT